MKHVLSPLKLAVIACCLAAPVLAADDANINRVLRLQNRLVHLPDGASPQARVTQLLFELVRLQPQFASRYFQIASKKLPPDSNYNRALNRMANRTIQIVKGSVLSLRSILRISLQIEVVVEQKTGSPTPTPYQAQARHVSEAAVRSAKPLGLG
jgi:hypothetical protein